MARKRTLEFIARAVGGGTLLLWRARERGSASGLTGRIGLFSAEPAAPHLQEGAENSLLGANLALT